MDPRAYGIPGLILILLSLGRLWAVGTVLWFARRLRKDGVQVEGKVVSLTKPEPDEMLAKQLVVEFTDHSGKVWSLHSSLGLATYRSWVGRTVTVTYLRDNPAKARIDQDSRRAWVLSLILGLVLGGIGWWMLIRAFLAVPAA